LYKLCPFSGLLLHVYAGESKRLFNPTVLTVLLSSDAAARVPFFLQVLRQQTAGMVCARRVCACILWPACTTFALVSAVNCRISRLTSCILANFSLLNRTFIRMYCCCLAFCCQFLYANAAASRNTQLLQQLLSQKRPGLFKQPFPLFIPQLKNLGIVGAAMSAAELNTDLACCCAALKAGCVDTLRLLFCVQNPSTYSGTWPRRMLLRYSVRYSHAACAREVVCRAQAAVVTTPGHKAAAAVVMQQHLHMAAARTDPWAAGGWVVLCKVLAGTCACGCLVVVLLIDHWNCRDEPLGSGWSVLCYVAMPVCTCCYLDASLLPVKHMPANRSSPQCLPWHQFFAVATLAVHLKQ
jgi:hypothetical protein